MADEKPDCLPDLQRRLGEFLDDHKGQEPAPFPLTPWEARLLFFAIDDHLERPELVQKLAEERAKDARMRRVLREHPKRPDPWEALAVRGIERPTEKRDHVPDDVLLKYYLRLTEGSGKVEPPEVLDRIREQPLHGEHVLRDADGLEETPMDGVEAYKVLRRWFDFPTDLAVYRRLTRIHAAIEKRRKAGETGLPTFCVPNPNKKP